MTLYSFVVAVNGISLCTVSVVNNSAQNSNFVKGYIMWEIDWNNIDHLALAK